MASQAMKEAIRNAYPRKVQECHPDGGGTDEVVAQISAAYERLIRRS
jgi:hypothetical protein